MRCPLEKISIERFRGLRNVDLHDLGKVNILVGQTNSGKTSALEAISLLSDPTDPMVWVHASNRREPSPLAAMMTSKVDRLRYMFPLYESASEDSTIALRTDGGLRLRSIRATFTEIRGMRPQRIHDADDDDDSDDVVAEVERVGAQVRIFAATDQAAMFDSPHTFQVWEGEPYYRPSRSSGIRLPVRAVSPYEHWLRYPIARAFSEAVLAGDEHSVLTLLKDIEPDIVDVKLLATQREPALYLKNSQTGFLPVSSFGDGIRRVLTLAFALPRMSGGILLIDEIETGLHHGILTKVYSWLVRACHALNVQLFATTHSLEALDALLAADTTPAEDTVCFNLAKTRDTIQVTRYPEKQLRRLRDTRGLDLR